MDGALEILLQQLVDGQAGMYDRLGKIETTLAERKGERKVALWLFGTLSGTAGATLTTIVAKLFGHRGP